MPDPYNYFSQDKHAYYEKCLNSYDDEDIYNCCENYITGILWTFNYYFNGCKSWKYVYNYRHCPSLNDIISTMNSIKFKTLKVR